MAISPYLEIAGAVIDRVQQAKQAKSMMEYQNDYNSPKNQVARLHAAGLSPWSFNPNGNQSAQPVFNTGGSIAESMSRAQSNKIADRQLDIQENLSKAQAEKERSQSSVNQTLAETNRLLLKYLPLSEEERIRAMRRIK